MKLRYGLSGESESRGCIAGVKVDGMTA